MTSIATLMVAAAVVAAPSQAVPFRMPVGAKVVSASPDGRGWGLSGELDVPFVQARARLLSAAEADGWRHVHSIELGSRRDRVLMSFRRGDSELTVMVSRVGVAKCAFSCGVSAGEGRKG